MFTPRNSVRVNMHAARVEEVREFYGTLKQDDCFLGLLAVEGRELIYTNPYLLDFMSLRLLLEEKHELSYETRLVIIRSLLKSADQCRTITHGCINIDNIFIRMDKELVFCRLGPFGNRIHPDQDLKEIACISRLLGEKQIAEKILHAGSIMDLLQIREFREMALLDSPPQSLSDLSAELTRFTTIPTPEAKPDTLSHSADPVRDPENLEVNNSKKESLFSATLSYIWSQFT